MRAKLFLRRVPFRQVQHRALSLVKFPLGTMVRTFFQPGSGRKLNLNIAIKSVVILFLGTSSRAADAGPVFMGLGSTSFTSYSASSNGSIVVGQLSNTKAFRWTAAGGLVTLPALPGGTFNVV